MALRKFLGDREGVGLGLPQLFLQLDDSRVDAVDPRLVRFDQGLILGERTAGPFPFRFQFVQVA